MATFPFTCTIVSRPKSELPHGPYIVDLPSANFNGGELFTDSVNKQDSTGEDLLKPAQKYMDQRNVRSNTHYELLRVLCRGGPVSNSTQLPNMRDGDKFVLELYANHCYCGDCTVQ